MEIINGLIAPHNLKHIERLNDKGLKIYPTDEGFYEHLSAFGVTLETLFKNPQHHAECYLCYYIAQEVTAYFTEYGKEIDDLTIITDGTGFYLSSVETDEETKGEILELLS